MSKVHVARAELTLARDDGYPLREVPQRPDPLSAFARVFSHLRSDLGESAAVRIDLLPVTGSNRRRRRRRASLIGASRGLTGLGEVLLGPGGSFADQVRTAAGLGHGRPRAAAQRGRSATDGIDPAARDEARARAAKLLAAEPQFELQVLVRVQSEIEGRPEAHLQAFIACFDQFAGLNRFRVVGQDLGLWFLGADAFPWRRRRFDRRMDTGLFAPARSAVVTAGEVRGFLKPPTVHCAGPGVIRSGGVIPPPPHELPEFRGQPHLLPLGKVRVEGGSQLAGVPLADTFFSYFAGRSRYGKTETAINQFIHLARSGHGCFFLDPHEDALNRIKPYLTSVADRVVEINLAPRGSVRTQAGWNLFSMEGRKPEDKEARVDVVVNSFASALRWSEINNRALALTTMAAQSLVELSLHVPPELAPTIFQISTLLSNDEWRAGILPLLPPSTREFWTARFPRLASEAITVVTNLIDRLRSSSAVAALLGASRSTYDIRRCMDEGKVVLACPAGNGDKDRLVANFLVYDVLQAALSRKDTPPDRRRPFWVFFDEVQTYDGASRGNLGALLEQAAKYGIRAFLINQNPERLTQGTFDAVTTNRSHLASTVVNARAAALIAREWGGAVAPQALSRLEKFTYVASVTLGPRITPPFLVRGIPVEELWGSEPDSEAVGGLEEAITRNLWRRPIATTLSELESLDERILAHLDRQTIERAGGGPYDAPALRPGFVRMDPTAVRRGNGGPGGKSWR
jgi:hypothetical protein